MGNAECAGHAARDGSAGQACGSIDQTLGTFAIAQAGNGHAAHGGTGQGTANETTYATLSHSSPEQGTHAAVDGAFNEGFAIGPRGLEAFLGRLGILRRLVLGEPLSNGCIVLYIGLDKHGLILAPNGRDDFARL